MFGLGKIVLLLGVPGSACAALGVRVASSFECPGFEMGLEVYMVLFCLTVAF